MSDSLGTLQFKDSDKADRAVIVLLCIYGVSDHGVYGDIYNHNFKENIQFYGIGDMVLKIDQICSWLNTPQATTEPRFLCREMEEKYRESCSSTPGQNRIAGGIGRIEYERVVNAKELLVVYVKYRQNASLQGSVRGKLTKGITVHFRSALELMRMINMVKKQR
ncbi:hypothetical protein [[Clostridium] symbiosum]|uniref:hypothetical protein n=1 Tax=Clostridium symbiosum TaxID=1512 RepID=UPI0018A06B48|nr:hypothetical protein [[Clostridium] symbiosum]